MRPVDDDKLIEEGYVLTKHGISNCVITTKSIADVPTLDETEIIRNVFERVVERLEDKKTRPYLALKDNDYIYKRIIKIVKEECGINE